ncbi:MAG: hypothetical protein CMH24_03885 [Nitrosomonadales bacterium]|nr:hypothetical protein [Nitrosomonadales bacterium]|tara:strand:+ start:33 stop:1055 length:1023 start_codon:yes stop_codon:yes gene_type:complete
MKNRDERTSIEINSHMAKAKSATQVGMPFSVDEYSCLICNAYFRKKIYQSDLQVIVDLKKFFWYVGNNKNSSILEDLLESTNDLKNNASSLQLKKDFQPILSDDLKNKLRGLHNNKQSKDSRFHGDDDFYAKYARDLDGNFARNVERFNELKLKKNSRILDIGCGFGLFSHIATSNGHKVDSIDMPNASPILKEAAKLLKVNKYEFTVKKNKPLLKLKNKYDVVTAFQIFFNGHSTSELWDVEEWKYFLMDLHDNVLRDDGYVNLVFNAEHRNLKPIIINGETSFLGKKSLEEFFKPFFTMGPLMARLDNKMFAKLTKKNIKDACQSNIFKKRSFSISAQ